MMKLGLYQQYVNRENVTMFKSPCNRLIGFDYNRAATYSRDWDNITMTARGLVFDSNGNIASRSLDKFYNLGEPEVGGIEGLPKGVSWIALEKADGSMISSFNYSDEQFFMTRGSFVSSQAIWAKDWAYNNLRIDLMDKLMTYVFEGIYPQNRIVVDYGTTEELRLIAVRNPITGEFMPYDLMVKEAEKIGCGVVKKLPFKTIEEIVEHCKTLPMTEEGYVIRFDNGLMVKIKGEEYCKIHRIISHVTPLSFWRSIDVKTFTVPSEFLVNLPEEFKSDISELVNLTETQHKSELQRLYALAATVPEFMSDTEGKKQRYQYVHSMYGDDWYHVLNLLNGKEFMVRDGIHRLLRPTRNIIDGVALSDTLKRFLSESDDT